jgi:hypothetical protein
MGPYFADFACREEHLIIEVDGSQHAGSARDQIRDRFLTASGWSVLRLWNVDVLKEREAVVTTILAAWRDNSGKESFPMICGSHLSVIRVIEREALPLTLPSPREERERGGGVAAGFLLPARGEKVPAGG